MDMASARPASADRNHVADVTKDGRADLIGWNDASAWVELSTGSGFSAPQQWAVGTPFHGNVTNLTGDVNGDGRADLIGWNDASAWVELSTGSGFSAPQQWAVGTPFHGSPAGPPPRSRPTSPWSGTTSWPGSRRSSRPSVD
jgi:hypothetical protein